MRIRSRLLLLVCAVLLPALVATALAVGYVYREEQQLHRQIMRETVRALALALDRDVARREAILGTLASAQELRRGDLGGYYGFLASVAAESDSAVILSDLEGRQILNTRLPFGAKLPPMLPQEREDRRRLGNDATLVSDLYLPPAGLGPHSFAVQVPVRLDGRPAYFLTMAGYASQLQRLLAEQRLTQGWMATVLDRRGVVVARSDAPEQFVGTPVREGLRKRLAEEAEGEIAGANLAGDPVVAFFSRAPNSGWFVLLSVPRAAFVAPAIRASLATGAVSLVLLALGLAAAALVARSVSRSVESLRGAAERLGRLEALTAPRSGTEELDAVGAAMAEASARLRGATAELERRVAEAVANFERSQRALVQAQKLEALGRLTGGIAHDFNNVLQTLTAGLQAVRLGAREDQQELLSRCQRAVVRGAELARQLMAFGRVQDVRVESIATAARLEEARHLFAGALPANIRLEYAVAPDLWPVTVDPTQLELALLNLVINARDAMPLGGRIVLRGANEALTTGRPDLPAGEYVVLSVVDSGEGMVPEVMAQALDPFFTTKGVGKGSGMGLPQAYAFARQFGGTLTLDSAPGRGTTARIYLPRGRGAATPREDPPQARASARASRGKVLLVEDDEHVRETVSRALAQAGFEIHTAPSGDEALRRIDAGERFDAVFTDVVMPGNLSGVDLATEVRRRHPDMGVVMATGYAERSVQLPGVRALAKPYDVEQAVEALNAAIAAGFRTAAPG